MTAGSDSFCVSSSKRVATPRSLAMRTSSRGIWHQRGLLLLFDSSGSSAATSVLLLEAFDAARGIDELLLAREKWVATRANFHREAAARGERVVFCTASTRNRCGFISWMNALLGHDASETRLYTANY